MMTEFWSVSIPHASIFREAFSLGGVVAPLVLSLIGLLVPPVDPSFDSPVDPGIVQLVKSKALISTTHKSKTESFFIHFPSFTIWQIDCLIQL
jgi:hypothetical protein